MVYRPDFVVFLEVFQDKRTKLFGIRDVITKQEMLLPNNDWLMFENKEQAERVCRLLNRFAID